MKKQHLNQPLYVAGAHAGPNIVISLETGGGHTEKEAKENLMLNLKRRGYSDESIAKFYIHVIKFD